MPVEEVPEVREVPFTHAVLRAERDHAPRDNFTDIAHC